MKKSKVINLVLPFVSTLGLTSTAAVVFVSSCSDEKKEVIPVTSAFYTLTNPSGQTKPNTVYG
jgi:hypothetical protein